ncbi:hypothetical protein PanWU01x14_175210 [Parasponia andersonii]|uniref:Uncharacterized protein n=1 Tax=Parasponia andersonii TaxID=3476 RepID=A0A2P5C893_PARAD|nr:hypothetical protein PanWU01x14_175210 [Parasponia andersonii]
MAAWVRRRWPRGRVLRVACRLPPRAGRAGAPVCSVGTVQLATRMRSAQGLRVASPRMLHGITPRMVRGHDPAGRADIIRAWPVGGLLCAGRAGGLPSLRRLGCRLIRLMCEHYASTWSLGSCLKRGRIALCEPVGAR